MPQTLHYEHPDPDRLWVVYGCSGVECDCVVSSHPHPGWLISNTHAPHLSGPLGFFAQPVRPSIHLQRGRVDGPRHYPARDVTAWLETTFIGEQGQRSGSPIYFPCPPPHPTKNQTNIMRGCGADHTNYPTSCDTVGGHISRHSP